eukprot:TRINITY_DN35273_c0_g1_i1.p1 TRINITY_DN35273_c0_g1~~TRINITY_DN35273_c0_g1_i1.p1  ORF type:complete len:289 (+),score=44.84 TRINITY_DN35273_c0_g1_i1:52-918(+)
MSQDLQVLLNQYSSCFELVGDKIVCRFNGQEIKNDYDAFQSYLNGKKFQKLLREKEVDATLSKYEPFFVPSIIQKQMIFCTLTGRYLKKDMECIQAHMKGKNFQLQKLKFQEDKMELYYEPGMEPKKEKLEEQDEEDHQEILEDIQEDEQIQGQSKDEQTEEDQGQQENGIEVEEMQVDEDKVQNTKKKNSLLKSGNKRDRRGRVFRQNDNKSQLFLETDASQHSQQQIISANGVGKQGEDVVMTSNNDNQPAEEQIKRKTKRNAMKQKLKRRKAAIDSWQDMQVQKY